MRIDAGRFTETEHDGDGYRTTVYWISGVWSAGGRLLWESVPDTFATRIAAIEAARDAKRRIVAGELVAMM